MITAILLATALILLVALVMYAVLRIIRLRHQYDQFKKKSKGLPMQKLPLLHPGGNMHEIIFSPYAALKLEAMHRKYGKTFGCMLSNQETVISTDLELIRLIIGSEANKHTNRGNFSVPISEFGPNGFWFNQTDRWKAMRRPFAPLLV